MERNPATGRMRKKCPSGYERNAKGKCVKKCKSTHERSSKGRCVKKCADGKVRNSSGKCVKTIRAKRAVVKPNSSGKCAAPRCFKSDAGNCSHPNPWIMFLVNNKGKGKSMSQLKNMYDFWKGGNYSRVKKENRNRFLCKQAPNVDVTRTLATFEEGWVFQGDNDRVSRAR